MRHYDGVIYDLKDQAISNRKRMGKLILYYTFLFLSVYFLFENFKYGKNNRIDKDLNCIK